jgi:hypothetical protein
LTGLVLLVTVNGIVHTYTLQEMQNNKKNNPERAFPKHLDPDPRLGIPCFAKNKFGILFRYFTASLNFYCTYLKSVFSTGKTIKDDNSEDVLQALLTAVQDLHLNLDPNYGNGSGSSISNKHGPGSIRSAGLGETIQNMQS